MKNGLIVDDFGRKTYYLDNEIHREDGPAIEYPTGAIEYFLHGKRHNDNGPAIITSDGTKYWCLNDALCRLDGPAVETADGEFEWHIDGIPYTKEEFDDYIHGLRVSDIGC